MIPSSFDAREVTSVEAGNNAFDHLPFEIWLHVIEHSGFRDEDIANLSLVCRSFRIAAQAKLFSRLCITRRICIEGTQWVFWQDQAYYKRMLQRLDFIVNSQLSAAVKSIVLACTRDHDSHGYGVPHSSYVQGSVIVNALFERMPSFKNATSFASEGVTLTAYRFAQLHQLPRLLHLHFHGSLGDDIPQDVPKHLKSFSFIVGRQTTDRRSEVVWWRSYLCLESLEQLRISALTPDVYLPILAHTQIRSLRVLEVDYIVSLHPTVLEDLLEILRMNPLEELILCNGTGVPFSGLVDFKKEIDVINVWCKDMSPTFQASLPRLTRITAPINVALACSGCKALRSVHITTIIAHHQMNSLFFHLLQTHFADLEEITLTLISDLLTSSQFQPLLPLFPHLRRYVFYLYPYVRADGLAETFHMIAHNTLPPSLESIRVKSLSHLLHHERGPQPAAFTPDRMAILVNQFPHLLEMQLLGTDTHYWWRRLGDDASCRALEWFERD